MSSSRDSKIDATLSALILIGFLAIVGGNALCWIDMYGRNAYLWRWSIVVGIVLGTIGSTALSARVFWRHHISLAAWMLMFGIHATGMALATQLFNWVHPVNVPGNSNSGTNTLLLAISLIATLLVRGSVLQAAVKNMPGWMAIRNENESATPRLWLFALYWLSPLAWWGGIVCAITLWSAHFTSSLPIVALIVCIAIATIRVAVRFVLYEKNKYSNWARSLYGWEKFRGRMINIGFVLAGIVTFYSYFLMASRVQDDAVNTILKRDEAGWCAEVKSLQMPKLNRNENAMTIYNLASSSAIPMNKEWMRINWRTQAAINETARNLTALSFFRQATAVKGIDYQIDLASDYRLIGIRLVGSQLEHSAAIEIRQAASTGDWVLALNDTQACLRYTRHVAAYPSWENEDLFAIEKQTALTFAAALFHPSAKTTDQALRDLNDILSEHFNARGEYVNRIVYVSFVRGAYFSYNWLAPIATQWPGRPDTQSIAMRSSLGQLEFPAELQSLHTTLKIATQQSMDREDTERVSERLRRLNSAHPEILSANLEALETLRLLETAIAVKRYQLKHGTWPGTLNDCIPEFLTAIPPDPNKHGRFIQYESSPPRVYSIGKGVASAPEEHGLPDEKYFEAFELKIKECANGNHVLFLAN